MLPRMPLRFLLADDPGAGKTIVSGLYIRELAIRGDADRVLIVAPVDRAEGPMIWRSSGAGLEPSSVTTSVSKSQASMFDSSFSH